MQNKEIGYSETKLLTESLLMITEGGGQLAELPRQSEMSMLVRE